MLVFMRYEGRIYRPPSEADALIVQATIGCSWNHCTYCDMYSDKKYRVRPAEEVQEDIDEVCATQPPTLIRRIEKVFVADGDALAMPMENWRALLPHLRTCFPSLRRVSCYAMARNVAAKSDEELAELRRLGLSRLYIGPESGDDRTLKRIAKGDDAAAHIEAAHRAKAAGMEMSVIALLGIGQDRAEEHALQTAELVTKMDPDFFAALTVTVVPGTPLAKLAGTGRFEVPPIEALLMELRTMVEHAAPTDCLFRTNHASNYLPLGGRLPRDRERIVATIDAALDGRIPLRPEHHRGL